MSKNNVRIAIRDSTDSHNVAFFDNKAGIKYKSANLHRFLAGSASILTIKYNSKDIDSIRSGCKLSFRYKARDYWLNVMSFEKKGFEAELTAYSLGLELNNETRGEHKPANAMSIAEYVAYYDPEHALTIGVNEVSGKRIKLEWTGTDTILARLFSVANSFGAELDFSVELNDDYSLKRQVLNIYKKGNLGTNKVSQPVRVGKELKVINYSDNIKELRTAVRATGKDGLTIDGLDKKIYDNNKELLYYSSGMTVYAPQSRDRFPSVGKGSNDNWIVKDLGETQYETKEALWGYMYGEIQKISVPEITYEVEGAIEAGIGDTQTLIDGVHFEPALYVQARVSELEDDILTGKVTKSTFINFERKYSQIADILLKQVEALAEDAAPYIIRLSTNNGYIFKNGEGSSTITARLEKYSKDIAATWKWVVDNKVVGTGDKLTVKAEQVTNTMAVTVIAYVNGNEVVRDYMTFSNSDDGVGVESIDRYFTSSDQSDGVTIEGAEWSDKPPAPTEDGKYLWAYDEITYTDGTVTTTKPAAVGSNFDVDAFRAEIAEDLKDVPNREEFENKISEELANSKAEIETQIETAKTQAESNAKEYADTINQETAKVAELANAAAGEIKADLVNVKNNLTETSLVANNAQAAVDAAKQDLTNVTNELNTAKQDLMSHTQQLQTQANAQTELTKRVTTVETTANGTKTTVSELSKTVDSNTKNITSVTARTKVVEDDLTSTKTTLSQVKTTADSTSQKTATLETGLNGLTAKFTNLSVGNKNYLPASRVVNRGATNFSYNETSKSWTMSIPANQDTWGKGIYFNTDNLNIALNGGETLFFGMMIKANKTCSFNFDINNYASGSNSNDNDERSKAAWYPTNKIIPANTWTRVWFSYTAKDNVPIKDNNSTFGITGNTETVDVELKEIIIAKSNVPVDYQEADADIEQKVAEYKQTADQNYASLQSNMQTLDGTVKQNKSEFDQTASQIKSSISSVEGKIPNSIGGRNYIKDSEYRKANIYVNDNQVQDEAFNISSAFWQNSNVYAKKIKLSFYYQPSVAYGTERKFNVYFRTRPWPLIGEVTYPANTTRLIKYTLAMTSTLPANFTATQIFIRFDGNLDKGRYHNIGKVMLEVSDVFSDWQPAPEDTIEEISSLSSELKQTKDGITLLATKTELNSAKNELQSGIKTATDKANNNAQTISTHTTQISALNNGLSAKVSQSDFNRLSGRVTTAENNITAKANELSSKISSVESKLPSGEINLVEYGRPANGYSPYAGAEFTTHEFYYNSAFKMYIMRNRSTNEKTFGLNRFKVERNTDYTLYFKGFNNSAITHMDVWFLKRVNGSKKDWESSQLLVNARKLSKSRAEDISVTFNTGNYDEGYIRFDNNGTRTEGTSADLYFGDVSVKKGKSNNGWSPSLAELASSQDLKTAQSEFKQTTDAIKASVTSLDKSTVKSYSLTINSDGIVMKAGKSTSDFANAVGSYFRVNQNAINLFSDKINVKGNMIVSGAITSDKIASKQINTAHLNGKIITADVISSNAVTAAAIKAGAVTTDKMSANSINGDRITAGTLDAAKIKAGSITASQIASGTITSAQIKTGTISAANIAAGAITSDKIASNSIDASKIVANSITADKIAANAITADMITGGRLNSKNGATVFDLNAGTLTFNNNYGYIQRVASDKIFEITTYLGTSIIGSKDCLTSAFKVRKSDNSRLAGIKFTLNNSIENKPTATAEINADELYLYDSKNTRLFSVHGRNTYLGNFNMQGWGDIPVADLYNCGLLVKDIGIGGHTKSLLKIVEELCNKTGIWWI